MPAKIFPIVVATADPTAPIPIPLINTGSNTILATVPIILPIIASLLAPSARTTKLTAADQMINGAPYAM